MKNVIIIGLVRLIAKAKTIEITNMAIGAGLFSSVTATIFAMAFGVLLGYTLTVDRQRLEWMSGRTVSCGC